MASAMENMIFGGQGVKDHVVLPAQTSGGVSLPPACPCAMLDKTRSCNPCARSSFCICLGGRQCVPATNHALAPCKHVCVREEGVLQAAPWREPSPCASCTNFSPFSEQQGFLDPPQMRITQRKKRSVTPPMADAPATLPNESLGEKMTPVDSAMYAVSSRATELHPVGEISRRFCSRLSCDPHPVAAIALAAPVACCRDALVCLASSPSKPGILQNQGRRGRQNPLQCKGLAISSADQGPIGCLLLYPPPKGEFTLGRARLSPFASRQPSRTILPVVTLMRPGPGLGLHPPTTQSITPLTLTRPCP